MSSPNIKNQNTLFRFISLRNPELTKEKEKEIRFVFHPVKTTSIFFQEMDSKVETQTKWQVLETTAAIFNAFETEEQVKEIVGIEFFNFATFIATNRSNTDNGELANQASNLQPLGYNLIITLWDNLFYQVVTQKAFYIKEIIMQVLVAQNLLEHKQITRRDNEGAPKDAYFELANARVVLPAKLFEKEINFAKRSATNTGKPAEPESKQSLLARANNFIIALEKAKAEIISQAKQYQKEFDKAYKIANTNYEIQIAPLVDNYNKTLAEEKENICKNPPSTNPNSFCNQPKTEFPILPKFEFSFEPTIANLSNEISNESFNIIQEIDGLKNAESYQEIIVSIDAQIETQYKNTLDNTIFEQPILMAGGVAIPLVENKIVTEKETKIDTIAFVPEKFGVRQIGIADYKKVVAHVCCYDAGEVSHIENIMAKEMRSKSTTRERIEEFTETTETQQEREALTDTTTSERFEMQTEVSKLLQEQRQFDAHASLSGGNSAIRFEVEIGRASCRERVLMPV